MKLHLGCGNFYIPDALNIDKYELRIADVQADALRLPIRHETCDPVIAYHLFEHLGYIGSLYAIAEIFRVLKPGGVLELETPDPEYSFQAFLDCSEPLWRANVLTWIFGEETSGMGHRGLFPKALLEKMVNESGFCDLEFAKPKTHRHRWGLRLVARKDKIPAAGLVSRLRPLLVSDILHETTPQEAIEIELRVWDPIYRFGLGSLSAKETEDRILDWLVIAPQVVLSWCELSQKDEDMPKLPSSVHLKEVKHVAQALMNARSCFVLRDAFSALCATVNQVADGYNHLFTDAKHIVKKWLAYPPLQPESAFLCELETFGVKISSDPNLSFPGDLELSLGHTAIDGRTVHWPNHGLFTRQHLINRAQWFRDLGIRCFSIGQLEEARRLFRLAINSKLEGLYSVWNMARLQAALGQKKNAKIFYNAALGFPMPDEIKDRILSELRSCTSGKPEYIGPVSVGEGQDQILDILEKGIYEKISPEIYKTSNESIPYHRTLLWELTLKCQCRCSHCAAAGGKPRSDELSIEEALAVCDQIAKLGVSSVCLMGGEPLLHPDWEKIASRLRELGLDQGLATNGIALDTHTWGTLERLGFSQIVISLDGASAAIHDTRRQRKGALEAAQKAIREMVSRPIRERTVVTSIDRNNLGELAPLRDWLLEHAPGITWMINIASPTPASRMDKTHVLNIAEFLKLVKFIAESRKMYRGQLDVTGTHCMGYFSQKYPDLYNYTWSGCQAGITTLGLRSDGSITGCLIMSDHFIEGNVRQQSLFDIWMDPGAFSYNRRFSMDMLKGKCKTCRLGALCRGGCRETAFSFTGDPFDPPFCLHYLETIGTLK